jgi:hypothetical protein
MKVHWFDLKHKPKPKPKSKLKSSLKKLKLKNVLSKWIKTQKNKEYEELRRTFNMNPAM